jgi:hypothetical protein
LTTLPTSILKCRVDSGGESSSPWLACAPAFATGKVGLQMLMVGNENLMVLGGKGANPYGADLLGAQDVYVGKLDADGNVPKWNIQAGILPFPMSYFGVAVHNDRMFILGGVHNSAMLTYKTQSGNFTVGQVMTGLTSTAHGIIMADTDGGATGTVKLKTITGTFVANEVISDPLGGSASVNVALSTNYYLDYDTQSANFTVGQVVTGAGGAFGTISADTDNGATGTLTLTAITGTFVAGEALTDALTGVAKVAAGTTQYKTLTYKTQTGNFTVGQVVTGAGGAYGTIETVNDSGATGTLILNNVVGAFVDSELLLTTPRGGSALADGTQVIYNLASTAVYTAKISSDGTLGSFSLTPSVLPAAISSGASVVVYKDRILILDSTKLYTARIFEGGELSNWTETANSITYTYHNLVQCQNDDLLIFGGYDGANTIADVRTTRLEADGQTGVWYQTTPMSIAKSLAATAQIGDRVYSIGGLNNSNVVQTAVEVARVNSDGVIDGQRSI